MRAISNHLSKWLPRQIKSVWRKTGLFDGLLRQRLGKWRILLLWRMFSTSFTLHGSARLPGKLRAVVCRIRSHSTPSLFALSLAKASSSTTWSNVHYIPLQQTLSKRLSAPGDLDHETFETGKVQHFTHHPAWSSTQSLIAKSRKVRDAQTHFRGFEPSLWPWSSISNEYICPQPAHQVRMQKV